jgi:homoserine dehydrogenase
LNDIVILKLGSSVLRSGADLPRVVSEIYRHVRLGEHVVAVVSAFAGVTDRISCDARRWIAQPNASALAAAFATGEMESATQLVFALERSGVPVSFVDPRDVSLRTRGDRLNAEPASLDAIRLGQIVDQSPVTVIPGFYALAEGSGIALLGRGGSDLTAVYIADRLRARCVLVKDVDGLYEADPAQGGRRPRRFERAHYDDALQLGGELIQGKAIEHARAANQVIEIRAIGERAGTYLGPDASGLTPSRAPRPLRVFLCGLGTVGQGVYEFLTANPDRYRLTGILVRRPLKHLKSGICEDLLVVDPCEALERALKEKSDVVIEVMGGLEPAYRVTLAALAAGRVVVTANKELVATYWDNLASHLVGERPRLRCSAAVGGAAPMMELVQRLVTRGLTIEAIRGVVNGTSNFILDQLATGQSLDDAVCEAQAQGFAEADPSADVDGIDAARKIEILARLAWGHRPLTMLVTGIRDVPGTLPQLGRSCRLVASAQREGGARVGPEWLAETDYLAHARGAENRLEVTTTDGTVHRVSGLGAGRYPTATAILADLLEVSLASSIRPANR